jgi:hypothetical protein
VNTPDPPPPIPAVAWFMAWAVIGGCWALTLLGALSIGVFVLPFAVVATILLACDERSWAGLGGLALGAAILLLGIAYMNRDGPGDVCTTTASAVSCQSETSPWPWLAVGLAGLIASGRVFVVRRSRVRR